MVVELRTQLGDQPPRVQGVEQILGTGTASAAVGHNDDEGWRGAGGGKDGAELPAKLSFDETRFLSRSSVVFSANVAFFSLLSLSLSLLAQSGLVWLTQVELFLPA